MVWGIRDVTIATGHYDFPYDAVRFAQEFQTFTLSTVYPARRSIPVIDHGL